MNYNIILIILGSLLADILFCSCDFKNKHSNIGEDKSETTSQQLVQPTLIKEGDFISWSAKIDSCVIYCDGMIRTVKFSVKSVKNQNSSDSYSCRLTMPEENTPSFDLGNEAGDYIIRSVDSLFVRNLVPPIVSEKYDSTVYCEVDGYSTISFKVYIGGQYMFKEFPFVNELGYKRYEFSDCFEDLCDIIRYNSSNYIDEFYYQDKSDKDDSWRPPLKSEVYTSVDEWPEFPGGDVDLRNWIHENIRYPVSAKGNVLQGRVVVMFVVTKDGSVGKVKVMRSSGPLLDEEAVRVVKSLPKFNPGKKDGKSVDVWYTLPIIFNPDSTAK